MNRPLGLGLIVWLFGFSGLAIDYSTTNREALSHFWQAVEGRARPFTAVAFGDSMSESYRSPTFYLMRKLEERFGIAGYSLGNYQNYTLAQLTNGAAFTGPSGIWYADHLVVPPGGGVWYEAYTSPGGVFCDEVGIFYVAQPQGGDLSFSVSTNRGPWVTKLVLDGYSATPVGRFTNVALAANLHRIRVDSINGINFIVGPHLLMTHTNGLHVVFMDQPGIPLESVTNVPLAVRGPIFAALKPDLLISHMKKPVHMLSWSMDECENWWASAYPECDVVYVGTHHTSYDATNTNTIDQNQFVRAKAVSYGRTYVDLMEPSISFEWLWTHELILWDGVHLSSAGGQWGATVMWNDLGFFALGLPRRLSLETTEGLAHVSFPTAPGATYTLQSSTNLYTWTSELTTPGTGSDYSTNFTLANPQSFFRLRLTP